ncbi:hypothetical protein N665_0065s0042 [Sinapis alba]|nr:hypothetical protein N665_0065s0042 [Sinapis alba]
MSTEAEIDQVLRQMQQGMRKMTPLVAEQQPERDRVKFPKPAMVVRERWSRSSYQEQMEKRMIEIALERGISMEEIEEIQAMTNRDRPVMTPEEEKKKRLEMLEECRRMMDRWDEEDESKRQHEETLVAGDLNEIVKLRGDSLKNIVPIVAQNPLLTEPEEKNTTLLLGPDAATSEVKSEEETNYHLVYLRDIPHGRQAGEERGKTRKKKKRWKKPFREIHHHLEKSLSWDEIIDGFGAVQKNDTQLQENVKHGIINKEICTYQVLGEMFLRGKKEKMKIKKSMIWVCDSKKWVKMKRIEQELVFGELMHVRKEVLTKPARLKKCKIKPLCNQLNKMIKLRLSGNQTLLFGITKLAPDVLFRGSHISMFFIRKKDMSVHQRRSLMGLRKAGKGQPIYPHHMLNRNWPLRFKKMKKGRMGGVKRQLAAGKKRKFKHKHHNRNKKIRDIFSGNHYSFSGNSKLGQTLSRKIYGDKISQWRSNRRHQLYGIVRSCGKLLFVDRKKRPKSEYKLLSCEMRGSLLRCFWTKSSVKWKVVKLGLMLAKSLRRQLAVWKRQCFGDNYIRCGKELQLRGLMRLLTAKVNNRARYTVNCGNLFSLGVTELKKLLMEWKKRKKRPQTSPRTRCINALTLEIHKLNSRVLHTICVISEVRKSNKKKMSKSSKANLGIWLNCTEKWGYKRELKIWMKVSSAIQKGDGISFKVRELLNKVTETITSSGCGMRGSMTLNMNTEDTIKKASWDEFRTEPFEKSKFRTFTCDWLHSPRPPELLLCLSPQTAIQDCRGAALWITQEQTMDKLGVARKRSMFKNLCCYFLQSENYIMEMTSRPTDAQHSGVDAKLETWSKEANWKEQVMKKCLEDWKIVLCFNLEDKVEFKGGSNDTSDGFGG